MEQEKGHVARLLPGSDECMKERIRGHHRIDCSRRLYGYMLLFAIFG